MRIKIGDIVIKEFGHTEVPEYLFVREVLQTRHPFGTFKSIQQGIAKILKDDPDLRDRDRADLQRLSDLLRAKNGDLKEVQKSLIDSELNT